MAAGRRAAEAADRIGPASEQGRVTDRCNDVGRKTGKDDDDVQDAIRRLRAAVRSGRRVIRWPAAATRARTVSPVSACSASASSIGRTAVGTSDDHRVRRQQVGLGAQPGRGGRRASQILAVERAGRARQWRERAVERNSLPWNRPWPEHPAPAVPECRSVRQQMSMPPERREHGPAHGDHADGDDQGDRGSRGRPPAPASRSSIPVLASTLRCQISCPAASSCALARRNSASASADSPPCALASS